jgi:DNA-binding LytR/AlgR family response regulator
MCVISKRIQIAICDDEIAVCSDLEAKIMKAAFMLNIEVDVEVWHSGEKLCDYLSENNYFDIIYLDICLTRLSGIHVGHYIREKLKDVKTQIIYISSMRNYALQLFDTQPFDFLLKPITEKKICAIMAKICEIIQADNRFFDYYKERDCYRVKYDDILYFKSEARKVSIITVKQEISFYGKLKDIIAIAPPQFLTIHKSYLININFVRKYSFESIEMVNGEVLTISRLFKKNIRKKILKSMIYKWENADDL